MSVHSTSSPVTTSIHASDQPVLSAASLACRTQLSKGRGSSRWEAAVAPPIRTVNDAFACDHLLPTASVGNLQDVFGVTKMQSQSHSRPVRASCSQRTHFSSRRTLSASRRAPAAIAAVRGGYGERRIVHVDVAVVGGGPAGLSAAIALRKVLPRGVSIGVSGQLESNIYCAAHCSSGREPVCGWYLASGVTHVLGSGSSSCPQRVGAVTLSTQSIRPLPALVKGVRVSSRWNR